MFTENQSTFYFKHNVKEQEEQIPPLKLFLFPTLSGNKVVEL